MQQKDKYPENVVNPNFQTLLDKFKAIIKNFPPPEKVKDKLEALQKESTEVFITGRQKDAIWERCQNYINGTYGSTSIEYKVHEHIKGSKNG